MKRSLLFLLSFVFLEINAQSVGVGTTTPEASAILDVSGTTGGLLVPRLTFIQRDNISTPARGLLIFCSDDNNFYCYDGAWKRLAPAEHVWNLDGNFGTNSGLHYIGTRDAQPLTFAVGSIPRMQLHLNGRLQLAAVGNNMLIGEDAGLTLTTGEENIFIGKNAGRSADGAELHFVGYEAGMSNTIGAFNHFTGYRAGRSNTSGTANYFSGYLAGTNNTLGVANFFAGYRAGTNNVNGSDNLFAGYSAGANNISANANTFVGRSAGAINSTGTQNVYVGARAGHNNNGSRNTYMGYEAGLINLNASDNVFVGYLAGQFNNSGSENTFIGSGAAATNSTGFSNFMAGYNAGRFNQDGNFNCFIGNESGNSNISGVGNTLIGYQADVTSSGFVNAGAIGYRAKVSQSNSFVIGGTGPDAVRVGIGTSAPTTTLHVNGVVAGVGPFINLSDSRLKKNILPVTNALTGIMQLQPVSYDWKKEEYAQFNFENKRQIGFLAQELEKIFPEAVNKGDDGFYSIAYSQLIPLVVQGMKEQQQQVNELKNTVELLLKEIEKLKK